MIKSQKYVLFAVFLMCSHSLSSKNISKNDSVSSHRAAAHKKKMHRSTAKNIETLKTVATLPIADDKPVNIEQSLQQEVKQADTRIEEKAVEGGQLTLPPEIIDITPQKKDLEKNTPVVAKIKQTIKIDKNESTVFNSEESISEIFVVDNKIAEIKMLDENSFYIFGIGTGVTKIYISTKNKKDSYVITAEVLYPTKELEKLIHRTVPKSNVKIHALHRGILLEGSVDSTKDAATIQKIAMQYIGEKDTVVNNVVVKNSTQISLQVKIAEVSRTAMNKLNFDWKGNINGGIANKSLNFNTSYNSQTPRNILTYTNNNFDISAMLDMLITDKKASILAEPTLMTLSGRSASFNAGGEIPYQTNTTTTTGTTPQIEFKQYGIALSFTPTIIGQSIHLTLKTEVSDPDTSLRIGVVGNEIPAIRKKEAKTTVVLGDGQTLMIAGLLYNKRSATNERFPGLSDVPILGSLFTNASNDDEERELVIVVTPYLVSPMKPNEPVSLPTDTAKTISAYDAFFFADKEESRSSTGIPTSFKAGLSH